MRRHLRYLPLLIAACSTPSPRSSAPAGAQARYRADLAAVHMNYSNPRDAAALYRDALALETEPAEKALYHHGLSQACAALGDAAAAREELDRALSIYEGIIHASPQGAAQFLERYVQIADRPRARRSVDQVVARYGAGSDPRALVWLANVYVAMEAPAEGLKLYGQAEERTADPAAKGQLRLSQALLLQRLKDFDKAEALYQALIREGPAELSETATKNLLMLYASLGRTDKIQLIDKK